MILNRYQLTAATIRPCRCTCSRRAQISTGACFVSTSVLLSASWSACDDAFYMRTTACLLVSIAGFAVAVGSASGTQRTSFAANADTCAFSKTGRKIGCVQDASNCSLVDTWTRGQWQFAGQELDPKAIAGPPPEVAAKRVRRGVWSIVSWPRRRALGRVAARKPSRLAGGSGIHGGTVWRPRAGRAKWY